MPFRKKQADDVGLQVPPVDPTAGFVTEANRFAGNIQGLVDERNAFKERCEALLSQLDSVHHQLHHTAREREGYRRTAFKMINANGKLKATLDAVESLFRNIRSTSEEVDHLASLVPKELPKVNHEEAPIDLDAALHDQAPEPTQEEIEQLRTTLASLPQH